jgi:hypothetical protein
VDEAKEDLKQLAEWIEFIGWSEIPPGVRRVIVRGQITLEDKIPQYEKWAKEETSKAE